MIRVFTAFSGYDSQCLALNRANKDTLGDDYKIADFVITEITPL